MDVKSYRGVKGNKMKITIETTNSKPELSYKVVKEVLYDDLDIWDMGEIIGEALKSCGYAESNVCSLFGYEEVK